MSNNNPNPITAYCPHCGEEVLLKRKDFDTCLAVLLLIFTGIGFLIYVGLWYYRPKDRCIKCETVIIQKVPYSPSTEGSQITQSHSPQMLSDNINENKRNYCPFCGNQLDERTAKFCKSCGTPLS